MYFDEIKNVLKQLHISQGINIWHDQLIEPGDDWKKEIREHLAIARVAILMVSPDFLISDFIRNEELPLLLKAAKNEGAKIIWIPVRFSNVKNFRFNVTRDEDICIADYQAVCDPKKPLEMMKRAERNAIYNKLCDDLSLVFQKQIK